MAARKPKVVAKPKADVKPKAVAKAPKIKKPTPKAKPVKKKVPMYIAVKVDMYHPFAQVNIPTTPPGVQLDADDSWLKSQLDRGIIKEL